MISPSSLLDVNSLSINNSCCYVCLQISVKFQVPLCQSVERQVLDTFQYSRSTQESPPDGSNAVYARV